LDLKNPYSGFRDDIPDYIGYTKKLAELSKRWDTTFLKGIEIGIVPGQEETIKNYLISHPHDLILVSIHQNGHFDYMDELVLTKDKFAVAQEYFQQMLAVLLKFHQGDVLTHFDYGLRRFDFSKKELEQFEPLLTDIFKKVIDLEMAVELNAKSFIKYGNAELYEFAVPLYIALGGKSFTLGSDAHVASDYRLGFQEMASLLQKNDIEELTVFQGKERFLTPLPI
ncbi:PHP domain-containing protein, partial [uncultured Enterococcus sp.]|uniref:PHP domain-containing protein n=1 Tax=uncultured Enterococcus sp. TaxID=167972 RepID=UPI002AA6ADC9